MSGPTTYPVRALPIEERLVFTYYKLNKPQYAPYLAAIQAVMNQYIVPYAYFALAEANDQSDDTALNRYTTVANAKINEVLGVFSVTFNVAPEPITGGLRLGFRAQKGGNTAETSHEIKGQGPDFAPLYEQSKNLAKVRWEAYTRIVTEDSVREILRLAGMGYESFMLDGTPGPRQVLAVIKHKMKIGAVDPQYYINKLKDSVSKYESGYQYGVSKYSYISRWIMDGFVAAVKAAGAVYQVL
jgi:hypothetical protein